MANQDNWNPSQDQQNKNQGYGQNRSKNQQDDVKNNPQKARQGGFKGSSI